MAGDVVHSWGHILILKLNEYSSLNAEMSINHIQHTVHILSIEHKQKKNLVEHYINILFVSDGPFYWHT